MNTTPSLSRIRVYPVKSLRGVDREIWELDAFGLRYDRRWMIVDPDGNYMTRRDHPEMAQIELEMAADSIQLAAPQRTSVAFPLEPEPAPAEPVAIWGDKLAARPASEDASRWLSEFLRVSCRLVYMPEETVRPVDADYDPTGSARIAFTDGFPLLLLSEESMEELNRRMPQPLSIERFRPNLVVKDVGAPHAEDTWRRIRVGHVEMHVVKPCPRCVITTTDPSSGDRGKEPLRTLATYRQRDGKVWFGQNVVHAAADTLRVRETIQVLESGEAPAYGGDGGDAGTLDEAAAGRGSANVVVDTDDAEAEALDLGDVVGTADAGEAGEAGELWEADDLSTVLDERLEPESAVGAEPAEEAPPAGAEASPDAMADDQEPPAATPSIRVVNVREPKEEKARLELEEADSGDDMDLAIEPAAPATLPVELRFTQRPEPAQVLDLYRAAGRNETAGDPDPGRIERTLRASNVLVSGWRADALVAVLRGWTDGARDGFIADVVVHPDMADTELAVELVRRTTEAHPGVEWVFRPGEGASALGEALGWTALGLGWWKGGGG